MAANKQGMIRLSDYVNRIQSKLERSEAGISWSLEKGEDCVTLKIVEEGGKIIGVASFSNDDPCTTNEIRGWLGKKAAILQFILREDLKNSKFFSDFTLIPDNHVSTYCYKDYDGTDIWIKDEEDFNEVRTQRLLVDNKLPKQELTHLAGQVVEINIKKGKYIASHGDPLEDIPDINLKDLTFFRRIKTVKISSNEDNKCFRLYVSFELEEPIILVAPRGEKLGDKVMLQNMAYCGFDMTQDLKTGETTSSQMILHFEELHLNYYRSGTIYDVEFTMRSLKGNPIGKR